MTTAPDLFYKFIDSYEQGQFQEALRLILRHPEIHYDEIVSNEPLLRSVVNFADVCVRKGLLEAYQMIKLLEVQFRADRKIAILALSFLEGMDWEASLIQSTIRNEDCEPLLNFAPEQYQSLYQARQMILEQWEHLKKTKEKFCDIFEKDIKKLLPWHPFSYPHQKTFHPKISEEEIPILFLEPIENYDWGKLLDPFKDRQVIFAFETIQSFMQLLQFSEVTQSLTQPNHLIYILENYPNEQFLVQNRFSGNFKTRFMLPRPHIQEISELLINSVKSCLEQSPEELSKDTEKGNLLYQMAKNLLLNMEARRYGPSRFIALHMEDGTKNWFDPHKGILSGSADLGPAVPDYLEEKINLLKKKRGVRKLNSKGKLRVAHIVPQVVDGGHAPTRLLAKLLLGKDNHIHFEEYLISSECFSDFTKEYPIKTFSSLSSVKRGASTLNLLSQKGVHTYIETNPQTYETTINRIKQQLKESKIDVAIFHGPDEVNSLCSAGCDVPIRVLFEHGTLPTYLCFDYAILSTQESYDEFHEVYKRAGMESSVLNFCVNARENWEKEPYSRKSIGLPEDSFIMTTISNHLSTRLSPEMCQAIADILKSCPKAHYAPMGEIKDQQRFMDFFAKHGVEERVHFLGSKSNPSQYARSMHMYLNEFPFGSGLAILDAMAAGCPVVSMYDPEGVPQARYAGTYFGVDRVIKTNKIEDYVNLACRLIQDPNLYHEWSEHAKMQYEKLADVEAYAEKFRNLLESYRNNH